MAAPSDSDGETAAPEAQNNVKHRAKPEKLPSYTREGITYKQLPAWHDANTLYAFRREHGKSQYNTVSDARAHFKKLEQGSINVWAAYDGKTLVGLVSAEATSEYRTRNGKGRPWAIGHLVVRASHRRKGVGSALVRLAAALLLAGNQNCAEVYASVNADDDAAIATFARAGFDELVTHADLSHGRDATVFRKRREGGVPKTAPKPPAPPPSKPKAEVVPRWQRDYAEGRPVYSVARDSYPGGEPRDSS
jgi:GNAT superfamily N-acetyltransferase